MKIINEAYDTLSNEQKRVQYDEKLELERRKSLASLIDIYEGKLNDIGKKLGRVNPLCKSWYVKHKNIDDGYLKGDHRCCKRRHGHFRIQGTFKRQYVYYI